MLGTFLTTSFSTIMHLWCSWQAAIAQTYMTINFIYENKSARAALAFRNCSFTEISSRITSSLPQHSSERSSCFEIQAHVTLRLCVSPRTPLEWTCKVQVPVILTLQFDLCTLLQKLSTGPSLFNVLVMSRN
jgi:hypothetical protein